MSRFNSRKGVELGEASRDARAQPDIRIALYAPRRRGMTATLRSRGNTDITQDVLPCAYVLHVYYTVCCILCEQYACT